MIYERAPIIGVVRSDSESCAMRGCWSVRVRVARKDQNIHNSRVQVDFGLSNRVCVGYVLWNNEQGEAYPCEEGVY